MKLFTILCIFIAYTTLSTAQVPDSSSQPITYHINGNVKNATAPYFQAIFSNWKDYLNSQRFLRRTNDYWSSDNLFPPEYPYMSLLLELREAVNNNEAIQCSILGIIPVENDYFQLNTMFTSKDDSTGLVELRYIVSVYAKKQADQYLFHSSTYYQMEILEHIQVGNINYILHPNHAFDRKKAEQMNDFNLKMAKLFEVEPIAFDYIVANNTTDLAQIFGMDFFAYSFQVVQSGGMADNYNTIIYAGNNSEYYPHEVVHLYTYAKFPRQYHSWVDEGIAAFFGGSTGYTIEWHIHKLKTFLEANPDYRLGELSDLEKDIPNKEYTTDFRYAIGGFLCGQIYKKEGMQGLFEALQAGRTESDYFNMLKEKLGFDKVDFETYLRQELAKVKSLSESELKLLSY